MSISEIYEAVMQNRRTFVHDYPSLSHFSLKLRTEGYPILPTERKQRQRELSQASKDPLASTSAHQRDETLLNQNSKDQASAQRILDKAKEWNNFLPSIIQHYKSGMSITNMYIVIAKEHPTFMLKYPNFREFDKKLYTEGYPTDPFGREQRQRELLAEERQRALSREGW
jgi:hypothetical protein